MALPSTLLSQQSLFSYYYRHSTKKNIQHVALSDQQGQYCDSNSDSNSNTETKTVMPPPPAILVAVPPQSESEYCVPPNRRRLYSMRGLELYSSSHPSSAHCLYRDPDALYQGPGYIPQKQIFNINSDIDSGFIDFYEYNHDRLRACINAEYGADGFALHTFRLGFDARELHNPITILVVVPDTRKARAFGKDEPDHEHEFDKFPERVHKVLANILEILRPFGIGSRSTSTDSISPQETELIHVNICRAVPRQKEAKMISLIETNPEVFHSTSRIPGSSIGPAKSENIPVSGTYSLGLVHNKDGQKTYRGFTCRHVGDPYNTLSSSTEASSKSSQQLKVERHIASPSPHDHVQEQEQIASKIRSLQNPNASTDTIRNLQITALQTTLTNAQNYNIEFGKVHSTSGCNRLLPFIPGDSDGHQLQDRVSMGRADWLTFMIGDGSVPLVNKHVGASGLFVPFNHVEHSSTTTEFRTRANSYLSSGPSFKPVRSHTNHHEKYFKLPGRTTPTWIGGTFNAIRSTLNEPDHGPSTRELCFLSLSGEPMSQPGDSGSIIVDSEFHPIGYLWGGDLHGMASGPQDMTYVSLLRNTLRDMEQCEDLEQGSLDMA